MTRRIYGSFAHNDNQLFNSLFEEFKRNALVNTKVISFCDRYILPPLIKAAEDGLEEIYINLDDNKELTSKEVFINEVISLLKIRGFSSVLFSNNSLHISFINQP